MSDLIELVNAHLFDGDTQAALTALDSHLDAQPDDADARRLRAETHMALNTPDHLRAALDDFNALPAPTPDDSLFMVRAYEKLGLPDQAISTLEAALALDSTHPRLLQRLAEILLAQGRYRDALDQVEKLAPDWRRLQMVGDVLFDLGLAHNMAREHAVNAYQSALSIIPVAKWSEPFRARMHLRLANVFQRLGDHKAVEREAAAAAKLIPGEPAVAFYQGWAQVKRGKPAQALTLLKKAFTGASEAVQTDFRKTLSADPACESLLESL
jgi:tetratricopeptide (TPR) repeat protein